MWGQVEEENLKRMLFLLTVWFPPPRSCYFLTKKILSLHIGWRGGGGRDMVFIERL